MGKKKKKHIQTEKERLHQEEAARLRAEKAAIKEKNERRQTYIMLIVALVLFALSCVFTVWSIARMHNFETNYIRVEGKIVDYTYHHHVSDRTYTLVISYTYDGVTYKIDDPAAYHARPDDRIGEETQVYVNPQAPAQGVRVSTSDGLSIVGVGVYAFAAVAYALGMALQLQLGESTYAKRALRIWLPVFAAAIGVLPLFWIGLPHDGFSAVFNRFDGTIGYIIIAALVLVACLVDFCVSKRMARKR